MTGMWQDGAIEYSFHRKIQFTPNFSPAPPFAIQLNHLHHTSSH